MNNLISLSDLNTTINHEPRVHDLLLASKLGFERPRAVRQLIDRNRDELEAHGPLATRCGAYRGQVATEYFLNEGQALTVCALSRTPMAARVRRALIDVFMAWRRGQLPARRIGMVHVQTMVSQEMADRIDRFAAEANLPPYRSRCEVLRRLIERGLNASPADDRAAELDRFVLAHIDPKKIGPRVYDQLVEMIGA